MIKTAFRIIGRALEITVALLWDLFFGGTPQTRKDFISGSEPEPQTESQKAGHEVSEPSPKAVVIFVGCFFVTILTAMAALGFLYVKLYQKRPASPVPKAEASFRYAPDAENSIARDWDAINHQAQNRLETYGWMNRKKGVTRIPIERATQLIVQEGLPSRGGRPPAFPPPDEESLPLMETEKAKDVSKSF